MAVRPTVPDWTTLPTHAFHGDPQSAPCTLYPSVYVLQLQHDKFYVGLSTAGCGVEQRWAKHIAGSGAKWCQQHRPVGLVEVYYPADKTLENEVTMFYATLHGPQNVRGGTWTSIDKPPPTQPGVTVKRARDDS
eukprot:COSAG05_NODE_1532_length_4620_cov_2.450564_2_plen_134_part_00